MLLQVYLRPYKLEEYEALVKPLGLWPFPRGHQRHLTPLPIRGATVLLADQRSCPLLPDSLRISAHPGLQPSAAQRGVDCNAACRYVSDAMLSATARPALKQLQSVYSICLGCTLIRMMHACYQPCLLPVQASYMSVYTV